MGGGAAESEGTPFGEQSDLRALLGISQFLTRRENFLLCLTFLAAREGSALPVQGKGKVLGCCRGGQWDPHEPPAHS